jgi:murein DD-endopeptidase MepM/ murein hydrolase activator NlpD
MRLVLPIAVLLLAFSPAATPQVYRWVDAHGVAHYTDAPPPSPKIQSQVLTFHNQTPTQIIQMRMEQQGTQNLAWADNRLAGPVEVELSYANANNIVADPPLPLHAVLPAGGSQMLSRFDLATARPEGSFELNITALPGDPNSKPEDVVYQLPVDTKDWRIDQGWGGRFSHQDKENFYAVDFHVEIGTPILAARDGVVMQVESNFTGAGLNREKYGARANLVRILHDDGSMAVYAHLRAAGVWVRQGQRVHAGQKIGLSGNTGYTTGPHLHFAVEVNRGMRMESIPVRIRAPDGSMLNIPRG